MKCVRFTVFILFEVLCGWTGSVSLIAVLLKSLTGIWIISLCFLVSDIFTVLCDTNLFLTFLYYLSFTEHYLTLVAVLKKTLTDA